MRERFAVGGAALKTKAAEAFGDTRKISVQFAGAEAGLRPIGLSVAGIEEGNGWALDCR
jgi:hypothetical protein